MEGRFTHQRFLFESCTVGRIYESRWGDVLRFIKQSQQHLAIMRTTWNEPAFIADSGTGDKDFRLRVLTETFSVDCGRFLGMLQVVLKLHDLPAELLAWCEGCPCHEDRGRSAPMHHNAFLATSLIS